MHIPCQGHDQVQASTILMAVWAGVGVGALRLQLGVL